MTDMSLIEALRFFRSLGFFADEAAMPDLDLAVHLGYDVTVEYENWGPIDDAMLLANDRNRAWWEDVNAGVVAGKRIYEKTLRDWAHIARGACRFDEIREFWGTEQGPVWVRLRLGDEIVRLHPRTLQGRLDLAILDDLNRLISSTHYQFVLHELFDSLALVVVLTREEQAQIVAGRRWRILSPIKYH